MAPASCRGSQITVRWGGRPMNLCLNITASQCGIKRERIPLSRIAGHFVLGEF